MNSDLLHEIYRAMNEMMEAACPRMPNLARIGGLPPHSGNFSRLLLRERPQRGLYTGAKHFGRNHLLGCKDERQ